MEGRGEKKSSPNGIAYEKLEILAFEKFHHQTFLVKKCSGGSRLNACV